MSAIWLNRELSRIDAGNRLFNAIGHVKFRQSLEYGSNTCLRLLVTGSEKIGLTFKAEKNALALGEVSFHPRKPFNASIFSLTDNITTIGVRAPSDLGGGNLLARKNYIMPECASVEIGVQRT